MEFNKENYARMYARMYNILCAAASDSLDVLPETAENAAAAEILRRALDEAEEVYLETVEDETE